jgi:hypothetical protein
MTTESLRLFFMWCTLINGGLLVIAALFLAIAGDWVYRIHNRLFPLPRDAFNVAIYCFIGAMKIIVLFLNLVPWLALTIIACCRV